MRNLIIAELLKWRRTKFFWVTVAATLASPVLVLLIMTNAPEPPARSLFLGQVLIWHTALLGPLVATLIGAQSMATEFQSDTWKLAMTAPVARWQVYLTKSLIGLGWMLGLTALVAVAGWLCALLVGAPGTIVFAEWALAYLASGAGLAALIPLYQLITLLSRSFFFTSGVGIIATVTGFVTMNSKYAGLHPISGVTVLAGTIPAALRVEIEAIGTPALWLSLQAGMLAGAILLGLVYIRRADIR